MSNKKEGVFGNRSDSDRYEVNERMTKNMEKIDYDRNKFGCTPAGFNTHDIEWHTKGEKWKGRCRRCGEEVEI